MGTPSGASQYVGILNKNHLRIIVTFGRHNFLDTYYQGSHISTDPSLLQKSFYNYSGLTLSFGITKRVTLESDNGYFINKTQIFNLKTKSTF